MNCQEVANSVPPAAHCVSTRVSGGTFLDAAFDEDESPIGSACLGFLFGPLLDHFAPGMGILVL